MHKSHLALLLAHHISLALSAAASSTDAATTTASLEHTTISFFMPGGALTNRIASASIIDIQGGRTTLGMKCNERPNANDYCVFDDSIVTVGPDYFGLILSEWYPSTPSDSTNTGTRDLTISAACDLTTSPTPIATCTESFGGPVAFAFYCGAVMQNGQTIPSVCSSLYSSTNGDFSASDTTMVPTIPPSLETITSTIKASDLGYQRVVITAGQEKLASATATGASTASGASNGTSTSQGGAAGNIGAGVGATGAGIASFLMWLLSF